MSLTRPSELKRILQELHAVPSKALGQNFLTDRNILNILLDAARLDPDDAILEIGPGLGVVTTELSGRVARVHAIEKDAALTGHLQGAFTNAAGVSIVNGDAMDFDLRDLPGAGFNKLVSNLPYNVGSRILMETALGNPPDLVVVMVQREVADRMVAVAGSKTFGILGLWLQCVYAVELVKVVSRTCFWPPPAVQSAIVRLERRDRPLLPRGDGRTRFHQLTRYAFMHRRKQLAALLAHAVAVPGRDSEGWRSVLESLGVLPRARPEQLTPAHWVALVEGPLGGAELHASLCSRRWDSLEDGDV